MMLRMLAVGLVILVAVPALAAQRTFVSTSGNDVNPCNLAQPCRSFTAAIAQTASGGEVVVLDSGGYGAVTITQSVSIIAPDGVYAGISILENGTQGVMIDAGATDVVRLQGLTLVSVGGLVNFGVVINGAGAVVLDRVSIHNFPAPSIVANSYSGRLTVKDCFVRGGSGAITADFSGSMHLEVVRSVFAPVGFGVVINVSSGNATAVIEDTVISGIQFSSVGVSGYIQSGSEPFSTVEIHVANTVIKGFGIGVSAGLGAPLAATVSVANSEISHNQKAVRAGPGPNARVALDGNRLVYNQKAIDTAFGGVVVSSGRNYFDSNVSDGDPISDTSGLK